MTEMLHRIQHESALFSPKRPRGPGRVRQCRPDRRRTEAAGFLRDEPEWKDPRFETGRRDHHFREHRYHEYPDNLDGNPILTGMTPREKGLIHVMQRRAEMMLIDAVDDYLHYGTPGLGAALRPWRMPDWGGAKEWGQRRGAFAVANMPYFNDVLGKQPFLAGDGFSMPDITLFAGLMFAEIVGLPIAPELTALHTWRGKVADLPAVKNRSGQLPLPEDLSRQGGTA